MNCPFCAEEIKDQAVVCKHCGRDLWIIRPVYDELRSQSGQISALKDEIAALRDRIESGIAAPQGEARQAAAESKAAKPTGPSIPGVAGALILAFLLLLFAYWAVVWVFDLDSIILLVASLLIPMLIAALSPSVRRLDTWTLVILSVFLGLVALLAMSGVKSLYEHIPILPRNEVELREDVEAACSIALSFMTGARMAQVRTLLTAADEGAAGFARGTEGLRKSIGAATPIITAIGALITGIRALLAH